MLPMYLLRVVLGFIFFSIAHGLLNVPETWGRPHADAGYRYDKRFVFRAESIFEALV